LYPKVLMYNYGEGRGMCGNTLYFNTIGATPTEYDTTDKFDVDATFLNLNYITAELFEKLKQRFPQKSNFEG
jgi:hypothetical protein